VYCWIVFGPTTATLKMAAVSQAQLNNPLPDPRFWSAILGFAQCIRSCRGEMEHRSTLADDFAEHLTAVIFAAPRSRVLILV